MSRTAATAGYRSSPPARDDIARMEALVRQHIRRTPVVRLAGRHIGGAVTDPATSVTLKLEQLQCSGSFKARGAFANLLTRAVPAAGVLAASGPHQARPRTRRRCATRSTRCQDPAGQGCARRHKQGCAEQ